MSSDQLRKKQEGEINDLLGLCRGIVSDGVVTDKEAIYLASWIARNPELFAIWPANVLLQRLTRILEDKILTQEELQDLKGMLLEVVNAAPVENRHGRSDASPLFVEPAAPPIDNPQPPVVFSNKKFCFVGRFLSGTRSWCEEQTRTRGGAVVDRVRDADYLVVGSLPGPEQRDTADVLKIEEGLAARRTEHRPSIISEKHWSNFLS